MQITNATSYSEIAVNALIGLNPPTQEQLAQALERASDELDAYADDDKRQSDRIEELQSALDDAAAVLGSIHSLHESGDIKLSDQLAQQLNDAITVADRVL